VLAQIGTHRRHLDSCAKLLGSLGYQGVLQRGFALVRDSEGRALRSAAQVAAGQRLDIELADGRFGVEALGREGKESAKSQPAVRVPSRGKAGTPGGGQGSLF
jgi:exodeoxyribonuclease VII large subunit